MHWIWGGIGLAAAALAVMIIWCWNRRMARGRQAEISLMATIEHTGRDPEGHLMMSFQGQNGARYSFAVPPAAARGLAAGQRGVLTFCGDEFRYFVRQEKLFALANEESA